jgi:FkbM family methyltransferase
MTDFSDRLYVRHENVDNEIDWTWVKEDTGSWDGPRDDWLFSHKHKYFEHVKQRRVVITAGGNMGLYARLYSKLFDHVYVFEPDILNFHCLVMNTQCMNVFKMNCALGSEAKLVAMDVGSHTNRGMFNVLSGIEGTVPMIKIDSFNFPIVDLLQLDVERVEFDVLIGAKETIDRCRPVIVVECGKTDPIRKFMEEIGYKDVEQSAADTIWIPK